MTQQIEKHLDTNILTPEELGRWQENATSSQGASLAKSAEPLSRRSTPEPIPFSHQLDKPTRSSLMALRDIILHCQPMTIPRNPTCRSFSVIYTDAYFKLKGTVYRPGDENLPQWTLDRHRTSRTVGPPCASTKVTCTVAHTSRVGFHPRSYDSFSSDQAFIYLLEAWAAILAPVIFEPWLGSFYVQCCDNEASRHALIKGVGKHQPLNCLISAHWTWHNRRGIAHRLERVPTKANISDALSRFEGIPEAQMWHQIRIPASSLTQRATKIIGDIEFASKNGFRRRIRREPIHDFLRKSAGKA